MWSASTGDLFRQPFVTLEEIRRILEAELLCGRRWHDRLVAHFALTDMMSRVLAECPPQTLLLTRLGHVQVVNTAVVAGLEAVVFLENRMPPPEVLDRAEALDLPILRTPLDTGEAMRRLCLGIGPES
jgi:predicted transcriptional regulator